MLKCLTRLFGIRTESERSAVWLEVEVAPKHMAGAELKYAGCRAATERMEEQRSEAWRVSHGEHSVDTAKAASDEAAGALKNKLGAIQVAKLGLRGTVKDLRTMSDRPGLIMLDKRRSEPINKSWQERMSQTRSTFSIDPR